MTEKSMMISEKIAKINLALLLFSFFMLLLCSSCKKTAGRQFEEQVKYAVSFELNWDSAYYPIDYPANAHFSKLIGWSHLPNTSFFKVGTTASEGIEKMAELGATTPLDAEVNTKITNEEGGVLFIGNNLASGVGIINMGVELSRTYPAITLVTMIAPSPDWYVGIVNVSLLEKGVFVDEKEVAILAYDAGTDNGVTYTSSDEDTSPRGKISLIKTAPLSTGGNSVVLGKVKFVKK